MRATRHRLQDVATEARPAQSRPPSRAVGCGRMSSRPAASCGARTSPTFPESAPERRSVPRLPDVASLNSFHASCCGPTTSVSWSVVASVAIPEGNKRPARRLRSLVFIERGTVLDADTARSVGGPGVTLARFDPVLGLPLFDSAVSEWFTLCFRRERGWEAAERLGEVRQTRSAHP